MMDHLWLLPEKQMEKTLRVERIAENRGDFQCSILEIRNLATPVQPDVKLRRFCTILGVAGFVSNRCLKANLLPRIRFLTKSSYFFDLSLETTLECEMNPLQRGKGRREFQDRLCSEGVLMREIGVAGGKLVHDWGLFGGLVRVLQVL